MIRLHPEIAKALGLVEIPEALLHTAIERVKLRVSNVDLTLYRRRPAQAALEVAACEAIVGAFKDFFPNTHPLISKSWPWVHVTLKGSRATVEMWIGHEYENEGDGIEPFDVTVSRLKRNLDFGERLDALMGRKPKHEPELELAKAMEVAREPEKPKKQSAGRELLDRNAR